MSRQPRVSREGKAREFRSKTRLQHRFIPDLIRFIEVSSWTVTYSTKLEAATIETFPSVYRDSKLFILPSVLRKKIEVLKRDGKHRLYTYITLAF